MKPAWDKLIKIYEKSKTALVADVDCTAEGKDLCEEHGVEGFPTIKWGDPADLQDYEGGRDFDDLKTFASENLKPLCSVANLDLCDEEKKKTIAKYQEMSVADLNAKIAEVEAAMKKVSKDFDEGVEGLQKQYEEMEKTKTAKIAELKNGGLSLMKSVVASYENKEKEEL